MLAVTFLGYSIASRELPIIGTVIVIIVLIGILLSRRPTPSRTRLGVSVPPGNRLASRLHPPGAAPSSSGR